MKAINNQNERDTYFELVKRMPLKSIRNDRQLNEAQRMITSLLSREMDKGTEEYLDALTDLVEKYESDHHDFGHATAAQLIAFLIEERGSTQAQVAASTGIPKSTISEIISGKRSVAIEVAKKLGLHFGIAPSVFIDCLS